MENLVSVIVPVYNSQRYLSECIESIINQTYNNLEIILVNDGSEDKSLEICQHYQSIDERITIINKKNGGVSSARNKGLEVSTGEYVGFVDSDDTIDRFFFETLIKKIMFDHSDLCALINYTVVKNRKAFNKETLYTEEAMKRLLLLEFPTSLWAYLYKKEALQEIQLNNEIHFFEDFEFNFRVIASASKISLCEKELYHYRNNEEGINNSTINYKRMSCLNIYNIIYKRLSGDYPQLLPYALFFRCHCIISIIASISKSSQVKEEFYHKSQCASRQILPDILFSRIIPIKYKISVLSYALAPQTFSRIIYKFKMKRT